MTNMSFGIMAYNSKKCLIPTIFERSLFPFIFDQKSKCLQFMKDNWISILELKTKLRNLIWFWSYDKIYAWGPIGPQKTFEGVKKKKTFKG